MADEGRGVPAEKLPYLFQKYSGLGGEGERGLRSTGLGLAICKGLVEAHGGRIWAVSGGVDQGARVTFTVPVAGEAGDGAAAQGARPQGSPRTRADHASWWWTTTRKPCVPCGALSTTPATTRL